MLTNILNFTAKLDVSPADDPVMVKIGPVSVSNYSFTMGIISALISIPVNLLIVIIFSKRRIRVKQSKNDKINTTDKYIIKEQNTDTGIIYDEDDDPEELEKESKRFHYNEKW